MQQMQQLSLASHSHNQQNLALFERLPLPEKNELLRAENLALFEQLQIEQMDKFKQKSQRIVKVTTTDKDEECAQCIDLQNA